MSHLVAFDTLMHPVTRADIEKTSEILKPGADDVVWMAPAAPFWIIGGFGFPSAVWRGGDITGGDCLVENLRLGAARGACGSL